MGNFCFAVTLSYRRLERPGVSRMVSDMPGSMLTPWVVIVSVKHVAAAN
jgi:hypothetical protein